MAVVYIKNEKDNTREEKAANLEQALKKFKKRVNKEGIMQEIFKRRYYISKSELRKQKKKVGRRKQLKKMYLEKALYD